MLSTAAFQWNSQCYKARPTTTATIRLHDEWWEWWFQLLNWWIKRDIHLLPIPSLLIDLMFQLFWKSTSRCTKFYKISNFNASLLYQITVCLPHHFFLRIVFFRKDLNVMVAIKAITAHTHTHTLADNFLYRGASTTAETNETQRTAINKPENFMN